MNWLAMILAVSTMARLFRDFSHPAILNTVISYDWYIPSSLSFKQSNRQYCNSPSFLKQNHLKTAIWASITTCVFHPQASQTWSLSEC